MQKHKEFSISWLTPNLWHMENLHPLFYIFEIKMIFRHFYDNFILRCDSLSRNLPEWIWKIKDI